MDNIKIQQIKLFIGSMIEKPQIDHGKGVSNVESNDKKLTEW